MHVEKKNLYGLKQAPRQWYKKFESFIENHDFNETIYDHCIFMKKFGNNDFIILLLDVDDMLIVGQDSSKNNNLKKEFNKSFVITN